MEQRIFEVLDRNVWFWRRHFKGDAKARFESGARLSDSEIYELSQGIKILSRGLTGTRNLLGAPYMEDPALLGAYLLFYWPLSYAQVWTILEDPGLKKQGFSLQGEALDLGSGPGPLSFALLDAGFERSFALDASPRALNLAQELAKQRGPEYRARLQTQVWRRGQKLELKGVFEGARPDIAVYGHVLNEFPGLSERQAVLKDVSLFMQACGADRIRHLVLEPALRQSSRDLLALREAVLGPNTRILGPCFTQKPCPALKLDDQTCHGAVHWQVPGLIQRLAHAARLGKEDLSMAWLVWEEAAQGVWGPEPPTKGDGRDLGPAGGEDLPPVPYRVCSEVLLNKAGFTRYMLCGGEAGGRQTLRAKRELLKSGEPELRKAAQAFFSLRRGDCVLVRKAALRDSGLGLKEDTEIRMLKP